jgi:TPR repeat protein
MKLRIIHFFRKLASSLTILTEKAIDRKCYIDALSEVGEDKPEGFFSLGKIYERGSAFMSHDTAMAYAMYCLSAERKMAMARQKALQLKSQLNARDWTKVNKTLKNFGSTYKV